MCNSQTTYASGQADMPLGAHGRRGVAGWGGGEDLAVKVGVGVVVQRAGGPCEPKVPT